MIARWSQDDRKMIARWLQDDPKMIKRWSDHKMITRWSLKDCMMIIRWSEDDHQMIERGSQDDRKRITRWSQEDHKMIARGSQDDQSQEVLRMPAQSPQSECQLSFFFCHHDTNWSHFKPSKDILNLENTYIYSSFSLSAAGAWLKSLTLLWLVDYSTTILLLPSKKLRWFLPFFVN